MKLWEENIYSVHERKLYKHVLSREQIFFQMQSFKVKNKISEYEIFFRKTYYSVQTSFSAKCLPAQEK